MPKPLAALPRICTSQNLAQYAVPGEPIIIFIYTDVGTTQDWQFNDRTAQRSFMLRWEPRLEGHILRVPFSVWSANNHKFAKDLMWQKMTRPVIVTIELTAPIAASAAENSVVIPAEQAETITPPEMGAPATQEGAHIVVGLSDPPAGASAVEGKNGTPEQVESLLAGQNQALLDEEQASNEALAAARANIPKVLSLMERAYNAAESAIRVKPLAEKLDVSEEALREAIAHPESRLEIAAAGWVKRKTE